MKATFYPVDGEPYEVEAETETYEDTGEEPKGAWLKQQIGCQWFQMVPLPVGELWIDEEGEMNGAKHNEQATAKFSEYLFAGDYIVGNAIFFPKNA